ncbi:hypothetical protein [Aureimonas leprariae]|uniref:Uncharacterized protein n=1 Tax=Plantimonas leprariae TaxID=2615207 RepID=A0A7V7PSG0_9HYPH|nr:hypothetical protein [Aureimonas leprariae]KAB0682020.1 hypothetical protein F6X38_04235 [Aureimonas leprariae]
MHRQPLHAEIFSAPERFRDREMPKERRVRPSPKPVGRPAYRPSLDERQTVEEMKFCGESDATIARSLGISEPTLRKHFVDELNNGHANRRKEVIGLMFQSARSGNVSAQKKLEEIGRVAGAEAEFERQSKPRAEARLGKKEQAKREAETAGAGTDWGDDLDVGSARLN